jgi:hypothetical protein
VSHNHFAGVKRSTACLLCCSTSLNCLCDWSLFLHCSHCYFNMVSAPRIQHSWSILLYHRLHFFIIPSVQQLPFVAGVSVYYWTQHHILQEETGPASTSSMHDYVHVRPFGRYVARSRHVGDRGEWAVAVTCSSRVFWHWFLLLRLLVPSSPEA